MNKKQKLELMGRVVTVGGVLHRGLFDKDYNRVEWTVRPIEPRAGWIVGFTHVRNGQIRGGGEDGRYLHVSTTVPAARVVFWPTRNPELVPLNTITAGGTPDNRENRWVDERIRAILREESKSYPRRNGRFCK